MTARQPAVVVSDEPEPAAASVRPRASGRDFIVALVVAAVVASAALVLVRLQPPIWTSSASLLIDQPVAVTLGGDDGPVRKLAALRLKYAALVKSDDIVHIVAGRVGLSDQKVRDGLTAVVPQDNLILVVQGQASKRTTAQAMTAAAARELVSLARRQQDRLQVPPVQQFVFTITSGAKKADQTAPNAQRSLATAVTLGLLALAGTYVLLQTRRSARD
ncbi:MAG: hypothetical protein QOJ09_2640 [Actinomycetota bacterium]|jgi:capsular polysaccharide biosynthesis protein|nr:hypothetical protein [Actinomycetota bacterium]